MTVDKETLQAANCWFGVDRVPDEQMTAFKREARYRQAQWRESRGYLPGTHRNSKKAIAAGGPETIANGTRLDDVSREQGVNFLSDTIRDAVRDRLDTPQDHQMLNVDRLTGDLLSSMPMCFNLFGELHGSPERASRAASLLLPAAAPGPVDVVFEWSPQRKSTQFTNDRTAFDAAFLVGDDGPRQVIGIETKYHEHATPEKKPNPKQLDHFNQQRETYTGIARRSQVFKAGWESQILGTELEQIWRDHLLLLSMLEHPDQWSGGRYVLVYPSKNVSFTRAAAAYRDSLIKHDTTFAALTLEELLAADVFHDPETASMFKDRYLW